MSEKTEDRLERAISPEGYEEMMRGWDSIRRLLLTERNRGSLPRDLFESLISEPFELISEALQAIRELTAERDAQQLRGDQKAEWAVREAQAARVAEAEVLSLRGALEPFAEASDACDEPSHADTMSAWESPQAMAVTIGDFRRARSALLDGVETKDP